jgi:hypothetical protein
LYRGFDYGGQSLNPNFEGGNMALKITNLERVWTKDGHHLGEAHRLYHRTHDINPEWEFYKTYLQVVSFEKGESYYIPTEFIADYAQEDEEIYLTVTMKELMDRTWFRTPDFIALSDDEIEVLPAM